MRTEHGSWKACINTISINLQLKSDFMYCSYDFSPPNKIYQSTISLHGWDSLLIVDMKIFYGDIRT